jgi:hypothetical protein
MGSDHTPRAPGDRSPMGTAATIRLPQQARAKADSGDPTGSHGQQPATDPPAAGAERALSDACPPDAAGKGGARALGAEGASRACSAPPGPARVDGCRRLDSTVDSHPSRATT